jgi:regulator of replication initiation timing
LRGLVFSKKGVCRESQEENKRLRDENNKLKERLRELEITLKKKTIFSKLSTHSTSHPGTILGKLNITYK